MKNRQFYALSKTHHPDRNPNDPTASSRFVAISEAYHTLGVPEKRSRYDRDYQRAFAPTSSSGGAAYPGGSHSSHTARSPAGGRPASGLSKRRTTFRGPPPSFYRSGGWGQASEKREAYKDYAHSGPASGPSSSGRAEGFGPGQTVDHDPTIPHWDRAGHFRTHEDLSKRREASGRNKGPEISLEERLGPSMVWSFFAVSSLIVGVVTGVGWFTAAAAPGRRQKDEA